MNTNRKNRKINSNIPPRAAARYWRATMTRDARADGTFVLAVRSTHIYCRPSCPARRPMRRNVIFFHTGAEAEKEGFRPCLRCRPNEVAGPVALVERASRELVKFGEDEGVGFATLAARLGTTPGTLRRAFVHVTGLRPRELAAALRLARFKKMLREGKGIAEALYETGYGSTSRVYESSNAQLGMTPATYRKGGRDMKIGYAIAKSSLGEGNCAARGGKSAEAGAAAGFASDGVSAARVAGAAEDSAGQHTHLYASGAGAGEPEVRAGGGEGVRDESGFDCGALSQGDS